MKLKKKLFFASMLLLITAGLCSMEQQAQVRPGQQIVQAPPQDALYLKSIYANLIPLLSLDDVKKLNYLLAEDLLGSAGVNLIEKHILFIKYVLNVCADTNEKYQSETSSGRLEWWQKRTNDTKNPWTENERDLVMLKKKLDIVLSQPLGPSERERAIFKELNFFLRDILMSYGRTSYDAIPLLTKYQHLSESDTILYETALRVSRLAPAYSRIIRTCVDELYKKCNPRMLDNEIAQELQHHIRNIDSNLERTHRIQYDRARELETYDRFSTVSRYGKTDFYDFLRMFSERELTDALYMLSAPQFDVDIARGILLKLAVIASERSAVGEHTALKPLLMRVIKSPTGPKHDITNFLIHLRAVCNGSYSTAVGSIYAPLTRDKKEALIKILDIMHSMQPEVKNAEAKRDTKSSSSPRPRERFMPVHRLQHSDDGSAAGASTSGRQSPPERDCISPLKDPEKDYEALRQAQSDELAQVVRSVARENLSYVQRVQTHVLKRKSELQQDQEKRHAKVAALAAQVQNETSQRESLETETEELESVFSRLQELIQSQKEDH